MTQVDKNLCVNGVHANTYVHVHAREDITKKIIIVSSYNLGIGQKGTTHSHNNY